jgi:hypothetical protein
MTTAILTSTGVTFGDSTTQANNAIPLTGNVTASGIIQQAGSLVAQQVPIWNWSYSWTHPTTANSTVDLLYNTGSYSDIHFTFILFSRAGANGFTVWEGIFGGYGGQYTKYSDSGGIAFTLAYTSISAGYAKISITNPGSLSSSQGMSAVAYIWNNEGLGTYNGTLHN